MSLLAQTEQGRNEYPRVNTIKSLARAIGVGLGDLVENEVEKPPTAKKARRKM